MILKTVHGENKAVLLPFQQEMRNHQDPAGKYRSQYADLRFEREGLFELIQEKYHPREVLYPGCSIHITPAFFFPHVVFVDQDPGALAFFSHREAVLDLVGRHRNYQRSPHIEFIYQDYTKPLPVRESGFDLVLALFAGGISKACRTYLRTGGLLVSNNHQNDVVDAAQDQQLSLIALVRKHKGKYRLLEGDVERPGDRSKAAAPKDYLRRTQSGFDYVENESYYIFKRIQTRT